MKSTPRKPAEPSKQDRAAADDLFKEALVVFPFSSPEATGLEELQQHPDKPNSLIRSREYRFDIGQFSGNRLEAIGWFQDEIPHNGKIVPLTGSFCVLVQGEQAANIPFPDHALLGACYLEIHKRWYLWLYTY